MDPTKLQPFAASPFNPKKKQDTEIMQALPRRQERLIMEQLKTEMTELRTEIERLTQVNCNLEERLKVTVDRLHIAETKLQIQKKAWQSISADNNQGAEHSMLFPPHKNIPRLALKNAAFEGQHSESKVVSSQTARRPMSARPTSARPASGRQNIANIADQQRRDLHLEGTISHDGQKQIASSHLDNENMSIPTSSKRPFSARNMTGSTPWSTPRRETRPSSARPVLRSSESTFQSGSIIGTGGLQNGVTDPLFTKFQPNVPSSDGQLSFGTFAANALLSRKAAQIVAENMSEQSATFGSLGLYLMCMWKEVNNCTANEPAPNYFRLAIACKIFDQVLGVVGMYSELLMELRNEIFACLFQGFDSRKVCDQGFQAVDILKCFISQSSVPRHESWKLNMKFYFSRNHLNMFFSSCIVKMYVYVRACVRACVCVCMCLFVCFCSYGVLCMGFCVYMCTCKIHAHITCVCIHVALQTNFLSIPLSCSCMYLVAWIICHADIYESETG